MAALEVPGMAAPEAIVDMHTLRQIVDDLKEEFKVALSHENRRYSPDWDPPYVFLPGRSDVYLMRHKEARVGCIRPCAKKVLELFNAENQTDYELVDCLDVCVSRDYDFYLHCNFTAKPKSIPLNGSDFSTKVFMLRWKRTLMMKCFPVLTRYWMVTKRNLVVRCVREWLLIQLMDLVKSLQCWISVLILSGMINLAECCFILEERMG
ncbi:uncharacterized protein [Spinacia oleracea]|uniref:Uncharacterized protein isoform X2 n=1 Tax=Spinacia oleracea TaxID=3562 RepID=A0ABM3RH40_SPIOL|nr:uncharacterized protein LOC110789078 isoform X2 [Spinacia oleracea]